MTSSFLVCAAVTLVSALVSLGFSIAAVRTTPEPSRSVAHYACARSTALTLLAAYPFFGGSAQWLEATAVGMIVVQALDAAIGVSIRDVTKTLGPAATALVNLAALAWLVMAA